MTHPFREPILGFLDYLKWGGLEPKFFRLRGVGPLLIPYYGYANSFIDGFCSRPNSVARFRKREVNNYGKFLYFLFSLTTTHDFSYCVFSPGFRFPSFLTFLYKMSTPSSRRLLPSAAPAAAPVSRPQRSLPPFLSLAPALEPSGSIEGVSSPSVPPATGTLARRLCLRCAKLAARRPDASCEFDKSNSEKCRYCQDQKSPCNPVSNLRFFSYLTTNFKQIPFALVLRGRELLRYRRRLRVASTEALRADLRAHIQTVARTFRGCAEGLGRGSEAPPREVDVVSGPVPPATACCVCRPRCPRPDCCACCAFCACHPRPDCCACCAFCACRPRPNCPYSCLMGAADVPTPGPARRAARGAAENLFGPPKSGKFSLIIKF